MRVAPSVAEQLRNGVQSLGQGGAITQRLMQQKRVSAHTIRSYRDTFRLLLHFARKRFRTSPDRLAFEKIDAPFVSAFLSEIEKTRGVGPRTRNLRLTAIRSFFRFAAYEMPTHGAQIQRVLAMPELRERFSRLGLETLNAGPEELGRIMQSDLARWSEVIRSIGIQPN